MTRVTRYIIGLYLNEDVCRLNVPRARATNRERGPVKADLNAKSFSKTFRTKPKNSANPVGLKSWGSFSEAYVAYRGTLRESRRLIVVNYCAIPRITRVFADPDKAQSSVPLYTRTNYRRARVCMRVYVRQARTTAFDCGELARRMN